MSDAQENTAASSQTPHHYVQNKNEKFPLSPKDKEEITGAFILGAFCKWLEQLRMARQSSNMLVSQRLKVKYDQ